MLLSGTGLLLISGAVIFALDPPNLFDRDTAGTELYNVDNKPTPEGLESLPRAAPSPVAVPGGQNQTPANPSPNSGPASRNPFEVARAGDVRGPLELDLQNDQNLQGRKLDFLNSAVDDKIYNPHKLQDPASPYQVMAGIIISASLVTGINSDLPGRIIAQVTENIFDTVSGRYLLIPQGARMIGTYDSLVAFGQERALVVWQRIIMPDGSSIVIDNLPATDTAGYAGLEDQVNFSTHGGS